MATHDANTAGPTIHNSDHVIWLPSLAAFVGGFVTVTYLGQPITAKLHAAKMEVVLLLNELLMSDSKKNMPPLLRGWRRYDKLIPMLRNSELLVESLQHTVCDINRTFRDAANEVLPIQLVPPLIDTRPGFGVHLHWQFRLDSPKEDTSDWP